MFAKILFVKHKCLKIKNSVSALGAEGREFESHCPDKLNKVFSILAYKVSNIFLINKTFNKIVCKKYDNCKILPRFKDDKG